MDDVHTDMVTAVETQEGHSPRAVSEQPQSPKGISESPALASDGEGWDLEELPAAEEASGAAADDTEEASDAQVQSCS